MRSFSALAAALGLILTAALPATAINIVPVFNAADNETPIFDLFNGGIQDLFGYSESYYQDIFEDPGYTLTVHYWYEDLPGDYLGLFNPVTTFGHRVTEANVRIDTRLGDGGAFRNWYIDSTPESDSEYSMQKIRWDDANLALENTFVPPTNNIPNALEIGYRGLVFDGSAAEGKFDMLSTVLHEIGHALGINGGATHENGDGDYDLNPDFIYGISPAVKIDSKDDGADPAHLLTGTTLMCGQCGSENVRRRPSHVDLFAMATSSDLATIDVPRREFYGGGVFGNAASWSGGRTPDNNDEAYIHRAGLVVMNAGDTVSGLTVSVSELATGTQSLNVTNRLRVESFISNVPGKLIVATGGNASAGSVQVAHNGDVDMAGGTLAVDGTFEIIRRVLSGEADGMLSGVGTVNVGGSFVSDGTIKPDGGTLTITAASFDLDGPNAGFSKPRIDATTGSVVFNGPHSDTFKETLDVGFAQLVTFNNVWTLGAEGEVTITDGGLINNATWHVDGVVQIEHTVPFGIVGVGGSGLMNLRSTGQVNTTGVVDFVSPVNLAGTLHVDSGTARFSGGGTFTDDASVVIPGVTNFQLTQAKTYTIESQADVVGSGTLTNGSLSTLVLENGADLGVTLVNEGRFKMGAPTGQANTTMDFTQTTSGVMEFDIGGYLKGKSFDHFDAAFTEVTLAGTLALATVGNFAPQLGDSFEIISAGMVTGTFDDVLGADLAGLGHFNVVYNPTSVLVEFVSGLPGDYNNDGSVDAADYTVWQDHLGDGESLPNDDTAGVGQDDYTRWQSHFGNKLPGGGSLAAVPEASAGATALLAAIGCWCGQSRSRRITRRS